MTYSSGVVSFKKTPVMTGQARKTGLEGFGEIFCGLRFPEATWRGREPIQSSLGA